MNCACKCVNPCAASKQELCVEHQKCVYQKVPPVFCAINHGKCEDRAICDRSVVKVKRCGRPSALEVSGHSRRVGAAQYLLIKGHDLAAIMRAGGWSEPGTVSRYLRLAQHNIWQ